MKTVRRRARAASPPYRAAPANPRIPATLMADVDNWARANHSTRSAAIRRLLELGLTIKPKPTQLNARRAKELAGDVIDGLADGAASADDRASRKSRLLKGPEEFRHARIDRPRTKR
ncbi:MAG: hypothetical protein ABW175_16095 [Bradyrhizobium sp.]